MPAHPSQLAKMLESRQNKQNKRQKLKEFRLKNLRNNQSRNVTEVAADIPSSSLDNATSAVDTADEVKTCDINVIKSTPLLSADPSVNHISSQVHEDDIDNNSISSTDSLQRRKYQDILILEDSNNEEDGINDNNGSTNDEGSTNVNADETPSKKQKTYLAPFDDDDDAETHFPNLSFLIADADNDWAESAGDSAI